MSAHLVPSVATVWNSGGCHSWYVGADGRNFTIWPAFANEYKRRLARFDPAEFELTSAPGVAGPSVPHSSSART